jgi:hypothetical protein
MVDAWSTGSRSGRFVNAHGANSLSAALMRSRPISVHRNVLNMAGSAAAGLLLSQLIYWTRHGTEIVQRDGWVFKTAGQWQRETGMTWKVQKRARSQLVQVGLIEERKISLPCRLEFRLNLNVLAQMTREHIQIQLQTLSLDLFRSEHQVIKELLGPVVSYHRVIAELVPHVNDALLLSRCLFDLRRSDGTFGAARWVALSRDQWRIETGLGRDEWETSRRHLRARGLLIEKHSNYPRRADLMVDCNELADQLMLLSAGKLSTGPVKEKPVAKPQDPDVRRNREKQGSGKPAIHVKPTKRGIGRNRATANPQTVSPDPSCPNPPFKNRPIPPITISQSPLYKRDGLQKDLLQQPLHASESEVRLVVDDGSDNQGVGVEVGSDCSNPIVNSAPVLARKKEIRLEGCASTYALVWPRFLSDEDRHVAVRFLLGIATSTAQEMLDEMAWQHQQRPVQHGPSYLRKLRGSRDAGTFVAEGAHRIRIERERVQEATPTSTVCLIASTLPCEPKRLELASELKARLQAARQTLAIKASAAGARA